MAASSSVAPAAGDDIASRPAMGHQHHPGRARSVLASADRIEPGGSDGRYGLLHAMLVAHELARAATPGHAPILGRLDLLESLELADGRKPLVDELPGAGLVLGDLA